MAATRPDFVVKRGQHASGELSFLLRNIIIPEIRMANWASGGAVTREPSFSEMPARYLKLRHSKRSTMQNTMIS